MILDLNISYSVQFPAVPPMSQYQLSAAKTPQESTGQLAIVPYFTLQLLKIQMEIHTPAIQWTQSA